MTILNDMQLDRVPRPAHLHYLPYLAAAQAEGYPFVLYEPGGKLRMCSAYLLHDPSELVARAEVRQAGETGWQVRGANYIPAARTDCGGHYDRSTWYDALLIDVEASIRKCETGEVRDRRDLVLVSAT